jgi:hypothetical protein
MDRTYILVTHMPPGPGRMPLKLDYEDHREYRSSAAEPCVALVL